MQSGYVVALQIQREKGCQFEQVQSIELQASCGIVGDCHFLNGEKQIAVLSLKAKEWMEAQAVKGLCFSRFQENILIKTMDFSELTQGVTLTTEQVTLEIIAYSKKCFLECSLTKDELPCHLKSDVRFAKVLKSGNIQVGDWVWIDGNNNVQ